MTAVSKILGGISKFSPVKKLCTNGSINADKFANAMLATTMTSIVIKDAIGCAMYTTQSLHNEKIPEKKRRFVAALDLTNGGLMIASQLIMAWVSAKCNRKIFDKIFSHTFDKNGAVKKKIVSYVRMQQRNAGKPVQSKQELSKQFDNMKNTAFGTFKFFVDLAAATILAKRVIVPFIATPLANKLQKRMDKHMPEENDATVKPETTAPATPQNVGTVSSTGSNVSSNLLEQYKQNLK